MTDDADGSLDDLVDDMDYYGDFNPLTTDIQRPIPIPMTDDLEDFFTDYVDDDMDLTGQSTDEDLPPIELYKDDTTSGEELIFWAGR